MVVRLLLLSPNLFIEAQYIATLLSVGLCVVLTATEEKLISCSCTTRNTGCYSLTSNILLNKSLRKHVIVFSFLNVFLHCLKLNLIYESGDREGCDMQPRSVAGLELQTLRLCSMCLNQEATGKKI